MPENYTGQHEAPGISGSGKRLSEVSAGQQRYLHGRKKHRRIVRASRAAILLAFLFLWEFTANTGIIDSFIFSSPSRIALCFWEMVRDKSIFLHLWSTLYETIVSFLLTTTVSILAAVLLWCSSKLSEILDPYLVVLNSLPKSALAPLLIVWLGATQTTIIVAGMSVAIFGSILSLYTSFIGVDPEKIKLIYTLRGNKWHALTKVVLPSSIPAIISNMKVNIGLCLVGVVIGEFLAARSGLGYLIIYSSQVFSWVGILIGCNIVYLYRYVLLLFYPPILFFKYQTAIPEYGFKYPCSSGFSYSSSIRFKKLLLHCPSFFIRFIFSLQALSTSRLFFFRYAESPSKLRFNITSKS